MGTDETNLFPDREELLAGLPARRADTLLFLIESRTAHLADRSRRAMQRFGTAEDDNERELAFFAAFSQGREPPLVPAIQDLERNSQGWAPLVAPNAQVRAAVAHRLGKKYRFSYQDSGGPWRWMIPWSDGHTGVFTGSHSRRSSSPGCLLPTGCAGRGPPWARAWSACPRSGPPTP